MTGPATPSLDLDNIAEALSSVRAMLAADGYMLTVREAGPGELGLDVAAGPEACADCLVPKDLMMSIALDALAGRGGAPVRRVAVSYPADGAR